MAAARPVELKLKVEEFDGDHTKSNRWLRNITAYLAVNDTMYSDNKKKVVTALSYMTQGATATWSEDFMDHAQSLNPATGANDANQTAFGYGTWNEFIEEFKKAFSPVDTQGTAMAQLVNLRQGKKELTEYIATFNQLALRAKVTDDVNKCNYFIQGLHAEFADAIVLQGQCHFTDYAKLTANCISFANDRARLEGIRRARGYRSRFQNSNGNSSGSRYVPSYRSPQKDPNAMDVDTTDVCLGKLSDKDREYLCEHNRCFRCRKLGHMARDCRVKFTTPTQDPKGKGKAPVKVAKIEEVSDDEEETACRMDF